MIKCEIFICELTTDFNDQENLFIYLPAVPRKGDLLHLTVEIEDQIKERMIKIPEYKKRFSEFYYGRSSSLADKKQYELMNDDDFSIVDYCIVQWVTFNANEETITIYLDNHEEKN